MRFRRFLLSSYLSLRKFLLIIPAAVLRFAYARPADGKAPRNILVIRADRIGDLVLTMGAFRSLKKRFPEARLTVAVSPVTRPLADSEPAVDETIALSLGRFLPAARFIKNIRRRNFDIAVDLTCDWRLETAIMTLLSGAPARIGWDSGGGRGLFFTDAVYGDFSSLSVPAANDRALSALGVSPSAEEPPKLNISKDAAYQAAEIFRRNGFADSDIKAAVHPGGHYPSQRWRPDGFAAVIKYLASRRVKICLICSSDEKRLVDRILSPNGERLSSDGIMELCGADLDVLAAVVARCDIFFGNNSGPLHIAAALNVPTVSVAGPTNPKWFPDGNRHKVLRGDLKCSPCSRGECRSHECMKAVSDSEAVAAIAATLDNLDL
ncbi:MAG: hypothetical protein CVU77_01120 [Elusimicrobia bacterium HGW-Elusimicrobia-1]|jgi:lipopolysaccharide heptosyltransferase II|nr:MAG: hypothetical protein CVU77_01120 [Elusimicrobia bacterium HGW-Elusimicrobia-1]